MSFSCLGPSPAGSPHRKLARSGGDPATTAPHVLQLHCHFAVRRPSLDELPALLCEDPENDKEGYDSDDRTDAHSPDFDAGRDELQSY